MANWASIKDAAGAAGVRQEMSRRRIWTGQIPDVEQAPVRGFHRPSESRDERRGSADREARPMTPGPWLVPDRAQNDKAGAGEPETALLQQRAQFLERERSELLAELEARRREVSELHALLHRAVAQPPPAASSAPEPTPPAPPMPARRQASWLLRLWRWYLRGAPDRKGNDAVPARRRPPAALP